MLHHPGMIEDVQLKCETLDIQEPKESEILIRVKFCAVCRTGLHLIEGDLPVLELPVIPGHQVVGIIEETGDRIDEFKKGDRVGVPWMSQLAAAVCIVEEEQKTFAILRSSLDLIAMVDMRNILQHQVSLFISCLMK